jgi:hypothetical protein
MRRKGVMSMKYKFEINEQLLENQRTVLQACMTVDSELGKRLRGAIFTELKNARNSIVESIKFANGDPRGTRHAVKRYIASKYLGGVVSIASHKVKKTGETNSYEAPRTLRPGQRGGNRRKRGGRTKQLLSYGPQDRAFILNFVNFGTQDRYSGYGKNGKNELQRAKYIESTGGRGFRGSIAPRNFFDHLATPAVQKAADNLGRMVEEEFNKIITA